MAILTQLGNEGNGNFARTTINFFKRFVPKALLQKCGIQKPADRATGKEHCNRQESLLNEAPLEGKDKVDGKQKSKAPPPLGYSAEAILQDKITLGFWNETFNQYQKEKGLLALIGNYSPSTWYRFDYEHVNWEGLLLGTAMNIFTYFSARTPPDGYVGSLAIDDTLWQRTLGVHGDNSLEKVTELLSWVYDHNQNKNKLGFRMMTALWTDGDNDIPVGLSLLTTRKPELMVGPSTKQDYRTWEGKRRILAQTKGTDVMVELVKRAMDAGIKFNEVLADTWFSNPAQVISIIKLGTHMIAMAKKGNAKYGFLPQDEEVDPSTVKAEDLQWLNVKEIYSRCKKRRGTSKYLISIIVWVRDKDGTLYPVRLLFLRNRSNPKDWIVLVCSNLKLSEEEIVRRYCLRWNIERYFKILKSFLKLRECRSTSYDALTAHATIVAMRYMLLSVERFDGKLDRTIECVFNNRARSAMDQLAQEACLKFGDYLLDSVIKHTGLSDDQIKEIVLDFIGQLPEPFQAFFDKNKVKDWT